jgi:hypothetical protein
MNEPNSNPPAAEQVSADQFFDKPEIEVTATPPADAAPAPAQPAPETIRDAFAGQKDSLSREWNPVKFRLKDGRPQLDTKGRFVPAGLGARPAPGAAGVDTPPRGASSSSLPPDDVPAAPLEMTAELSVEVAIGIVQTALIMIGEEEGVLDELEIRMLRGPMQRCIVKYNLASKMTPELETAAIIATLLMRRLKKPKTQGWFQDKLVRVRNWWIARRVRKVVHDPMPRPATVNA